jgi:tRNA(Arg) A34 adenosine deaminase TadA
MLPMITFPLLYFLYLSHLPCLLCSGKHLRLGPCHLYYNRSRCMSMLGWQSSMFAHKDPSTYFANATSSSPSSISTRYPSLER